MQLPFTTVVIVSLAIATPTSAQSVEKGDAPVLALVSAFSAARAHFNARALGALLTPDYVEVSPLGEIDRRQAVLSFYTTDKITPVPPMTSTTQDVRRYGDTAIVIGSVDYAMPDPSGTIVKRTMRVTYVEQRVGGRWLMASTQYTGVRPPRPAQ